MTSAVPYAEVIGDPIDHSKSPLIHNTWLRELGISAEYRAVRVRPDELQDYFARRRADPLWRGCNITMPLKEAALPLLDTIHRSATAIGAVNTVRRDENGRLHGRTTDLHGIWRALDGVKRERVVLIGSGGAARSAAYVMRRDGIAHLHVMARDPSKADRLASDLFPGATIGNLQDPPPADLLINATPMGMSGGDWPPLSLANLPPHATVFDMVYAPARTPLLINAEKHGLRVIGGAPMLLHQAQEAFATFFNRSAPEQTFAKLTEQLTT